MHMSLKISGIFIALSFTIGSASSEQRLNQEDWDKITGPSVLVEPGEIFQSIQYYQRLEADVGFNVLDEQLQPVATMDELISYFGFKGLKSEHIEKFDSFDLMPVDEKDFADLVSRVGSEEFSTNLSLSDFQNDSLLVSRFFAPKIVDYSDPVATKFDPGWRKLARVTALPGSEASNNGIEHGYILFNYIESNLTVDPFESNSKNNQVILVPEIKIPGEDSVYFMVFGESPDYKVEFSLKGVAFDLPQVGKKEYFVPVACAQCHGHDQDPTAGGSHVYERAIVNYLDTDQWHDAMEFDFKHVDPSTHPVVYDGGGDEESLEHDRAFNVIKKLNRTALAQTQSVDKGGFKSLAAAKWLEVHTSELGHVKPFDRVFSEFGSFLWSPSNVGDKELLGILNQNCFRCHGSIKYNIFDKGNVMFRRGQIARRISATPASRIHMPQGRNLDEETVKRIKELLRNM